MVTAGVWLAPSLGSVAAGEPPALLDSYTTSVIDALELGVTVPTLVGSAVLVLRRAVLGYELAVVLRVLLVLLALIAATVVLLHDRGADHTTAGPVKEVTRSPSRCLEQCDRPRRACGRITA